MTLAALSLSLLLASGTSATTSYAIVSRTDDPDSALLLVDARSLDRSSAYPTAVFLSIFPQQAEDPGADVAQSYVAEAECGARQLRYRDLVAYGNTGEGKPAPVAPSTWRVQQPGTTGDRMLSLICGGDGDFLVPLKASVAELITLLHERPSPFP